MPEEINIQYNKSSTIFNFLFVVLNAALCFLFLKNDGIIWLIPPLVFIFHITLFTINFIGLFRKNSPLSISKKGITYTPYNIFISTEQIKFVSYVDRRRGYIDILLKDNVSKYNLPKSLFGKIMITGGGLNFSNKKSIVILVNGLDINAKEFRKILIAQKLNKL